MMPKVTLQAPPHVDGGQIHASQSGKVYDIGADGLVTVDSADVKDLLGIGFTVAPAADVSDETKQTTASVSPTSATQGATALDPEARTARQRDAADTLQGGASNQADHGGADPGHGKPAADASDPKVGADAAREAEAKAAAGGDPAAPSAKPETGGPNQQASTAAQQRAAGQAVPGPTGAAAPAGATGASGSTGLAKPAGATGTGPTGGAKA